jgi:hypothetical protein
VIPATLHCHPETAGGPVRSIEASVTRSARRLRVAYVIKGEIGRLLVPAPRPPRVAERLWQHTCCEIFIARKSMPAYHEFNFAPSGEWAAYAFARYREGGLLADEAPDPGISVRRAADRFELEASLPLDRLSLARGALLLGLSAVIEDDHGGLSCWALEHPAGKPDFHHREGFTLELDEVRN